MANWQIATLLETKMVASNVKSLIFSVPGVKHQAGQHYDIRLTAEGGYQAERSYSAANPPEDEGIIEFGIQLLEDGEVSPYLYQLAPGDQIEVRGPIGGHFVWDFDMAGPLALIGGGSGMVPLMSMVRHHFRNSERAKNRKIIFLVSARTIDHVLYREELEALAAQDKNFKFVMTITDKPPVNWHGYARRIDQLMTHEVFSGIVPEIPMFYICGPTPFVEASAKSLVALGINSHEIRTERFGGA